MAKQWWVLFLVYHLTKKDNILDHCAKLSGIC